MAYIFSLTDSSFYMEIPAASAVRLKRRVVSVETLEGTEHRDIGMSATDLSFSIDAELDDDNLAGLAFAVKNATRLGLSRGVSCYSILIGSLEAVRKTNLNHAVKIEARVTGEI